MKRPFSQLTEITDVKEDISNSNETSFLQSINEPEIRKKFITEQKQQELKYAKECVKEGNDDFNKNNFISALEYYTRALAHDAENIEARKNRLITSLLMITALENMSKNDLNVLKFKEEVDVTLLGKRQEQARSLQNPYFVELSTLKVAIKSAIQEKNGDSGMIFKSIANYCRFENPKDVHVITRSGGLRHAVHQLEKQFNYDYDRVRFCLRQSMNAVRNEVFPVERRTLYKSLIKNSELSDPLNQVQNITALSP